MPTSILDPRLLPPMFYFEACIGEYSRFMYLATIIHNWMLTDGEDYQDCEVAGGSLLAEMGVQLTSILKNQNLPDVYLFFQLLEFVDKLGTLTEDMTDEAFWPMINTKKGQRPLHMGELRRFLEDITPSATHGPAAQALLEHISALSENPVLPLEEDTVVPDIDSGKKREFTPAEMAVIRYMAKEK